MDSARSNQVQGVSPRETTQGEIFLSLLKAQTRLIVMQNEEISFLREELRKRLVQGKKSWWRRLLTGLGK